MTSPFDITITLHRVVGHTDNPDGTSTPLRDDVGIDGCVIWPASSSETTQGQDNVFTGLTLVAPPGTVIESTDTVTVQGLTYNVTGDAFDWVSPFTGTRGGVQVALTRAH